MSLTSVPHVSAVLRGSTAADVVIRYWVTAVCAGSAGVHAALIQPHLSESVPLGLAFAAATAALAVAALMVRQPRHDSWAPAVAAAVLGVIAVSYLLSRTTGIPLLIDEAEQLDPVGAVTTVAELAGALCGAVLMSRKDRA